MQSVMFWAAVTLYAVATIAWFVWLSFRKELGAKIGLWSAIAALIPHAVSLGLRWAEVGHGPYNTRYEVLSADTFLLVLVWVGSTLFAPGLAPLGVLVLPAAFLLMGFSISSFELKNEVPIIFKSYWLALHIGFAKLFAATSIMSAACSTTYLIKRRRPDALARMPSVEKLDLYSHQFLLVSFLFCAIMMAAGSLWAHQSWGRYWGWDPIETSALVTWLIFGIVLHFRVLHGWTGDKMAWLSFVAFAAAMFTTFVVVIIIPTIHNSYMVAQ